MLFEEIVKLLYCHSDKFITKVLKRTTNNKKLEKKALNHIRLLRVYALRSA
jgi:hypothetical protein